MPPSGASSAEVFQVRPSAARSAMDPARMCTDRRAASSRSGALAAARKWLDGEAVTPLALRDERAPAMLWAMNYADTTVGAYTELVLTVLARQAEAPPLAVDGPWELAALALDPEVRGFIHR